ARVRGSVARRAQAGAAAALDPEVDPAAVVKPPVRAEAVEQAQGELARAGVAAGAGDNGLPARVRSELPGRVPVAIHSDLEHQRLPGPEADRHRRELGDDDLEVEHLLDSQLWLE